MNANPSPAPLVVVLLVFAAVAAAAIFHVIPTFDTTNGLPDPSSPAAMLLAIVIIIPISIVSLVVYFLPTIVAARRAHPQLPAICVLDVFLGWTVVGWVIALVWANTNPQSVVLAPPALISDDAEATASSASVLPDIAQL